MTRKRPENIYILIVSFIALALLISTPALLISITQAKYMRSDEIAQEINLSVTSMPTLVTGENFKAAIKSNIFPQNDLTKLTKIVFGNKRDYGNIVDSYTGVNVDKYNAGFIKLYLIPNESDTSKYTAYVIAQTNTSVIATNENASNMFSNMTALESIEGMSLLRTFRTSDMKSMFEYCGAATLDLSSFDTSNVTTMVNMFRACGNITSIDVSSFNAAKVKDMTGMFGACPELTAIIGLDKINARDVKNLSYMFSNSVKLSSGLDFSGFADATPTNAAFMFRNCKAVTSLNLTDLNTSKTTNMEAMFAGCRNMTEIDMSANKTTSLKNAKMMFSECDKLVNIKGIADFDTSKVENFEMMFFKCISITELQLRNFDTSNAKNMHAMFMACLKLEKLDISGWENTSATNFREFLSSCYNLTDLNMAGFKTPSAITMAYMFNRCFDLDEKAVELAIKDFDTSNVTDFEAMFWGCESFTNIPDFGTIAGWDTSSGTNFSDMFANCDGLTNVTVNGFVFSDNANMVNMFRTQNGWEMDTEYPEFSGRIWNSKLETIDFSGSSCGTNVVFSYLIGGGTNATYLDLSTLKLKEGAAINGFSAGVPTTCTIKVADQETANWLSSLWVGYSAYNIIY